jgi:hypothetical protein
MFITMMFGFAIVHHPACRMRGSPAASARPICGFSVNFTLKNPDESITG